MPSTTKLGSGDNIVLISVDCWRGDHFSMVNPEGVRTPNLDAFAETATCFENAHTCGGWTKLAMTSLMTSTYACMHDFTMGKLGEKRPVLAEELRKNGYKTAGITTNLVCGIGNGFDHGFDEFDDLKPAFFSRHSHKSWIKRQVHRIVNSPLMRSSLLRMGVKFFPLYPSVRAEDVVSRALKWLQQPHDKPYFLWLHFMDLHWPYYGEANRQRPGEAAQMWRDREVWRKMQTSHGKLNPGSKRAERWRTLYAQEVATFDTAIAPLLSLLDGPDYRANTHVVLTGDHGEEFYEHGTWAHSWNQLHNEGTHVPLIIRNARGEARKVTEKTDHLAIAPTLLDLAGAIPPVAMLGRNLKTVLQGNLPVSDQVLKTEMFGHANSYKYRLSIQDGDYRYIYNGDRDCCHLFDRSSDPEEHTDLYNKKDSISKKFDKMRLEHATLGLIDLIKAGTPILGEDVTFGDNADPEIAERLRALGYLE